MNKVDPFGLYAYKDKKKKIHVPIVWIGKKRPSKNVLKSIEYAKEKWGKKNIIVDFYESRKQAEKAGLSNYNTLRCGIVPPKTKAITRGSRDITLGKNWEIPDLAHEIGHTMGLKDEYRIIGGKKEVRTHLRTLHIQITPSKDSIMYDGRGEVKDDHLRIINKFIY